MRSSSLDPQELRFSLLFWDKLVWPSSAFIFFGSNDDETFLERAGILSRPHYQIQSSSCISGAQNMAATQIRAFLDLERKEPGVWAMAQGANSISIKGGSLQVGNGISVELHRAIPVPDKDVPLQDILEFRARRRDELTMLRNELDNFVDIVNSASNVEEQLKTQLVRIDEACANALKVGREWRLPVRLSNLKASLDLRPFATIAAGAVGWSFGATFELQMATAAIFGAGASFKIGGDFGLQAMRPRQDPYHYAYQFHDEVF